MRNGSPLWSPALRGPAAALVGSLERVEADAFARAVEAELRRRAGALVTGIETYRGHPYRRAVPEPPALWAMGASRLLDYGGSGASGLPLLVVPSLINRAYVLDLTEQISLLRWLASEGFRPFLLDWGRPGPDERHFTLTDYIAGPMESALEAVLGACGRPPVGLGYCMGGLLTLALALRRQDELAGLAFLATPWDFHADGAVQGRRLAATLPALAPVLEALGELPVDLVQGLFAALDPQLVLRKFLAFSRLDPEGKAAYDFVALEDWLNDGVPLAAGVARECLAGWYGENTTAAGRWRVAGRPVDPGALELPTLCLIPARDRIVPPGSAAALAAAIPGAEMLTPPAGHIGMVVSARAPSKVWRPLARWLKALNLGLCRGG